MYLIFSSEDSAKYILERSSHLNINMVYIPVLEIVINKSGVTKLINTVNEYDYVILTSAYAIKLADGFIKTVTKPVFITSGQGTATKLIELAINSTVLYPLKNSGSQAIIEEVLPNLDLAHKKILIVRGELTNSDINKYLDGVDNLTCDEIIVYQQKLLNLDATYLKKLLNDRQLQGIIITSSQLTNHLLNQAKQNDYLSLLKPQKFIVLHQNIKHILMQNYITHVNITQDASLAAIIDKIKGLI